MRQAMAFCPGHLTGFFQICRHPDPLATGSRGAGFSINLGAESRVVLENGTGKLDIFINGAKAKARVTESAAKTLLGEEKLDTKIFTTLHLPISQGFGMSAAGALSASLALSELLGQGEDAAYDAAHIAEVQCGTGLGDIAAIRTGGMEMRVKEGLPPAGEVVRLDGNFDMVLARLGSSIDTASVINDPKKFDKLNKAAEAAFNRFNEDRDVHNLFRQSVRFMKESGLETDAVSKALAGIGSENVGSMCMIGNSVFTTGPDIPLLMRRLAKFGTVYEAKVDFEGPRML
ncbi:MAG: Pantoate kinase [Methanomassiliicoccales archaeon PtaU1.Bin124]|nr:MAG: Pantoate kinase [Methanomassiliicoccales archaeon PtaU1.Bin124]